MNTINVFTVTIKKHHRPIKPHKLAEIRAGMEERGYNPSFPITLEEDNVLVDGRHRLEAAKQCGIGKVPCVLKPDNVLALTHSIRCNKDQTLGTEDDIFDLAEYCYGYAQDGWSGQQIAEALELPDTATVTRYSNIKMKLHSGAWTLAKELPKGFDLGNLEEKDSGNLELPLGNWRERHFRELLKHLAWERDKTPGVRTAQIKAISEILAQFIKDEKKVTAKWIGRLTIRYAWQIKLKCYALENLKPWVGHKSRRDLFGRIGEGVFGKPDADAEDDWWAQWEGEGRDKAWDRFMLAIEALNGKMPTLIHGYAEAMTEIGDESIDIIITSPPYNLKGGKWPMGGEGREPRENGIGYDQYGDSMPEDEYQTWQIECLKEMYRVARPGASLFYNHKVRQKDGQMIHPMDWLRNPDNPWMLRQEITWDRGSTHNHCPVYFWPHDERIYWMTKGKPVLGGLWYTGDENPEDRKRSTVWRFHGPVAGTWHPAPFPPELPSRCLQAVGREKENLVVLDPFAGRCTTIRVAMEEFGYDAIGIDISEEYLKKAKEENGWMNENAD